MIFSSKNLCSGTRPVEFLSLSQMNNSLYVRVGGSDP